MFNIVFLGLVDCDFVVKINVFAWRSLQLRRTIFSTILVNEE